jgi:threonine/homoserine/homoserine lactone efflux protein
MQNATADVVGTLFPAERNLSMTERAIYVAVGLGLAAAGAKPRPNPILNVVALAGGAYLAWTGYTGACPVKAALTDQGGSERRLARAA